ncbi:monocarboxylate transporter [Danaus plexippus plexippus]|uniref:Monocarboxylate transporter n=1 Tax=Danaus plexippus plexippus TaxID=278856 RepID=A0A212FP16_DANPL|nr:monocarboxylate transporter [Danaus plexippus plexippus]
MKSKQLNSKRSDDFTPPDGGWGWMIVVAAGLSNLAALPTLQQFGLLFRDKFARLAITSSETTTIINMHSALNSCVGLANGPVFKTFSYRQVSLTGAIVVFISLLCTTFSYNFMTYLISISILYGAGYGISSSANALALNTYWKDRRRLATGLSWTATGLGPILWPHIITALFAMFGETGTMLLLCGFSLHSIACALLLQPVEWHTKQRDPKDKDAEMLLKTEHKSNTIVENKKDESGYFSQVSKIKNLSLFSSQYLYNEDDPVTPGYEITDPGVPMMLRANDGYYSQSRQSKSKISSRDGSAKNSTLNSKKTSMSNLLEDRSRKSSTLYLNESKKNSSANLGALAQERETKQILKQASLKLEEYLKENEDTKPVDKYKILVTAPVATETFDDKKDDKKKYEEEEEEEEVPVSFCEKVALFFDLDLLKDFTFINLMLGVTLASFNELNFSILTPFILGDFGLSKPQVAFFMSLLAGVDITVRFCVPFVAGKIGWDNNTFFLVGVLSMAMGRVVLAYWQDYTVIILVAFIIGFGKGLRTVFMALVIPTHVPLHKLPGASGLQLMTAGIVYLALGPVVGWIKDNASTAVTLHCLNIFTYLTAISWGLEKYFITKRLKKEAELTKV